MRKFLSFWVLVVLVEIEFSTLAGKVSVVDRRTEGHCFRGSTERVAEIVGLRLPLVIRSLSLDGTWVQGWTNEHFDSISCEVIKLVVNNNVMRWLCSPLNAIMWLKIKVPPFFHRNTSV